jgi:Domain of unknown function (DUF397)
MEYVANERKVIALTAGRWQKSSRSNSQGNCVELAGLRGEQIAIRNSRDPHGPALVFTKAEMRAFIDGTKDGEFDSLVD